MGSKLKRSPTAITRDLRKIFLCWAMAVFVVKLLVIFNLPSGNIAISGRPLFISGVWMGADGESYLTGYDALNREGLFSKEEVLNYWPAGYPLVILLLSLLGKSWALTILSIVQSLIFSYAVYFFASELSKTRLKKFAYLTFLIILFNPTLSLTSIAVGYESLTASGLLLCVGLVIRSFILKVDRKFKKYVIINSVIFGLLTFVQPRLIVIGLLINLVWILVWKGLKGGALIIALSVVITLFFPASLIYRNNQATGTNSISNNLGVTMNIGAGDIATGGYITPGTGVECNLSGNPSQQDNQRVRCVLNWYLDNPTKTMKLFYNKSIYFWSPWSGPLANGTMGRNLWFFINPLAYFAVTEYGLNLINGEFGKVVSWLWLVGGLVLLFYGYLTLWRQNSLERFIGNLAMIAVATNWLISLLTIGDHRFRIPIMGLSLFLQVIGLKTLFKGGKAPIVDGPSLR